MSTKPAAVPGSVTADANVDTNLIPVELYGIVYIYNPANKEQLFVGPQPTEGAPPAVSMHSSLRRHCLRATQTCLASSHTVSANAPPCVAQSVVTLHCSALVFKSAEQRVRPMRSDPITSGK